MGGKAVGAGGLGDGVRWGGEDAARGEVRVYGDAEALYGAGAEVFVAEAGVAAAARGRFCVALSGGQTPAGMYRLLGERGWAEQVAWGAAQVFWGDERWVDVEDERSNEGMARRVFLERVGVPAGQIHSMRCGATAEEAAVCYEGVLRGALGSEEALDLVLLGLGEDGHTASLFAGSEAVAERGRWVTAVAAETAGAGGVERLTLTVEAINRARKVVFVVSGGRKAEVLRRVLEGDAAGEMLPAGMIRPGAGRLLWLVDAEAGRLLGGKGNCLQ